MSKEPTNPEAEMSDRKCPFCGGTEEIYSVYRDGGSTLYHGPCGYDKRWKNPNFKRRWSS